MSVQDNWLANLRALIDAEAPGDDKRPAYRTVSLRARLSEEYVYQLYTGKPNADGAPRTMGVRAAKAVARAFGEGKPADWFDRPPLATRAVKLRQSQVQISADSITRGITRMLADQDPATRDAAASLLAAIARNPEYEPALTPRLVGLLGAKPPSPPAANDSRPVPFISVPGYEGPERREEQKPVHPDHRRKPHDYGGK